MLLASLRDMSRTSESLTTSNPPVVEATSTVEISAAVPQEVPPAESQGSQMDVSVQIEAIPEGGKTSSGDSEEERLKDCFIQGTIAPKLTAVGQQRLHQEGIYLVVATKVEDNLFITQLVHDMGKS